MIPPEERVCSMSSLFINSDTGETEEPDDLVDEILL